MDGRDLRRILGVYEPPSLWQVRESVIAWLAEGDSTNDVRQHLLDLAHQCEGNADGLLAVTHQVRMASLYGDTMELERLVFEHLPARKPLWDYSTMATMYIQRGKSLIYTLDELENRARSLMNNVSVLREAAEQVEDWADPTTLLKDDLSLKERFERALQLHPSYWSLRTTVKALMINGSDSDSMVEALGSFIRCLRDKARNDDADLVLEVLGDMKSIT